MEDNYLYRVYERQKQKIMSKLKHFSPNTFHMYSQEPVEGTD